MASIWSQTLSLPICKEDWENKYLAFSTSILMEELCEQEDEVDRQQSRVYQRAFDCMLYLSLFVLSMPLKWEPYVHEEHRKTLCPACSFPWSPWIDVSIWIQKCFMNNCIQCLIGKREKNFQHDDLEDDFELLIVPHSCQRNTEMHIVSFCHL